MSSTSQLNLKNKMEIAIDFDGTCVTHEYPYVGKDIGYVPVLQDLIDNGHQLILFTMRCDDKLLDAVEWFTNNGLKLYGIQYNPKQGNWTKSNKCYAQLYIDDAALGCPIMTGSISNRPFVNWFEVKQSLINMGLIK